MTIDWADFTPLRSLLGGVLIGLAAVILLLFNGRIAGISGILGGALQRPRGDTGWRIAFLAGLLISSWVFSAICQPPRPAIAASWSTLMAAGLLVGYGSRLGNGCTSGHGVCGLANLSRRSLVAVACFMVTGFLTRFLLSHGGQR